MSIRVWPGCLACYNDGRLVGEWLDDADAIESWRCPVNPDHEEFQALDHEIPGVDGEPSLSVAAEWVRLWDRVEDSQAEAFKAWLANESRDPSDDLVQEFSDAYCGRYEGGLKEYAMEYLDEWEGGAMVRRLNEAGYDVEPDMSVWESDYWEEGGHVFRNR